MTTTHRILALPPRDRELGAVRVVSDECTTTVVLAFDTGTTNVYLGPGNIGTQWIAHGHRRVLPATARLIARRLLEAADEAEG